MMFVIVNIQSYFSGDEYYTGTYRVQGEYYISTTKDINEAKKYSTKARAEKGLEALIGKVGYKYDLEIKEVSNECI